jgi:hypothetical protein
MTVWVSAWQMQCCGEPFRLGSPVTWTVRDADAEWLAAVLGDEASKAVDAAEDHHSDADAGSEPVTGTVSRITAVHCRYTPRPGGDPRSLYPVPGSAVFADVRSADGHVADRGEEVFLGYLVKLGQVHPSPRQ